MHIPFRRRTLTGAWIETLLSGFHDPVLAVAPVTSQRIVEKLSSIVEKRP